MNQEVLIKSFSQQKIRCQVQGHQDQKIKHICMNMHCQKNQRLLCDYCIQGHKHNEQFLKIKDIETKQACQIYNWPITEHKQQFKPYLDQAQLKQDNDNDNKNSINNNKCSNILQYNKNNSSNKNMYYSQDLTQYQKQINSSHNSDQLGKIKELKLTDSIQSQGDEDEEEDEEKKEDLQITRVREYFTKFLDEIEKKVNLIQKEIVVQIQYNLDNFKNMENDIQEKLSKLFNIDQLKDLFSEFNTSSYEQELKKIDNFVNNPLQKVVEQKIIKMIAKKDEQRVQNDNIFEKIKQNSQQFLDLLDKNYEQAQMENSFLKPSKDFLNHLKFTKSTYGSSKESIKMTGNKMIQFISDNNWKMIYSEAFHRDERISLRFKLSCKDLVKSFFTIGVITKEDTENKENTFAETGTQFAISPFPIRSKESKVEGKPFHEIFYDGIDVQIDICISKNMLVFQDKDRKCRIYNKADFEKNDSWRLLISAYGPVAPTFIFF